MTQSWALSFLTSPKHLLLVDNIALFDFTVIPYDEGRTIEIFKDDLEGKFKFILSRSLREEWLFYNNEIFNNMTLEKTHLGKYMVKHHCKLYKDQKLS